MLASTAEDINLQLGFFAQTTKFVPCYFLREVDGLLQPDLILKLSSNLKQIF